MHMIRNGVLIESNRVFPLVRVPNQVPNALQKYENQGIVLGEGTYGKVYLAVDRVTGKKYAMKKMKVMGEEGIHSTTLREISLLKGLDHPNIIKLCEVVANQGVIYLVFEYYERDLLKHLQITRSEGKKLDPILIKSYMHQLIKGIVACHQVGIYHRDLKCQNTLINKDGRLIICDFGLARQVQVQKQNLTLQIATLWYRCPELLLGAKTYGPEVDMWSIGCIFGEMCLLQPLFAGDTEIDTIIKIFQLVGTPTGYVRKLEHFNIGFPLFTSTIKSRFVNLLDFDGIDLLKQLLECDPVKRISGKQALNHPYFDDLDKSKL